jgi:hypothetical protein
VCYELIAVTIASEELTIIREVMTEDGPDSNRPATAFEPIKGTKEVPISPNVSNGKVLCIDADLSPK